MTAARGRPRLDVLVENQHRRQRILDFLHANGAASSVEIAAGINVPLARIKAAMMQMSGRAETRKDGTHRTARYTALVETTASAQELDAMIRERGREGKARVKDKFKPQPAQPAVQQQSAAGGGVHTPGNHPIKDQGGQGARRRTAYINCYQNY